ncbi:plasmid replication protein, CyRepA1 family [Methylobacterium durans]|uniref:Replication origin-binding protein domain-containing protein n=1 Tax=Methylobacterium durans TaxID=2202825 RepID=A0A2U8W1B2_9HYPH|nr:plasmid replication protein, CyRepA1 family [Methylobacterium durans]AWN39847.1 hypothetical protein DK389_03985 [Methylobacterium durans]
MINSDRALKAALNTGFVGKSVADNWFYSHGWVNVELVLAELIRAVQEEGWAFCAQHTTPRCSANFVASDLVAVDVDQGTRLEAAMTHPLVRDHALCVYTTENHTEDNHRFRVVFATPRTITKAQEMRAATIGATRRLGGDLAAVDPTRISFGNPGAIVHAIGREMSPEVLSELIQVGKGPAHPGRGTRPAETTQSALELMFDQALRVANGDSASLRDLPQTTKVHCPFHDDRNASAFVTVSRRGAKGVHCKACAKTFWPEGHQADYDFADFEKTLRGAQAARQTGSSPPDRLVNGSPAQRILMGPDTRIVSGRATPSLVHKHLTLIKSPKGSGKTEGLIEFLRDKRSVLVVGHRRSLLAEASRRLGISYYLDDPGRVDGKASRSEPPDTSDVSPDEGPWPGGEFLYEVLQAQKGHARRQTFNQKRLAICVDSLMQISPSAEYKVIVFDESEQVCAHFLSETMGRPDGPGPHRIFTLLTHLVRHATYIVALDADLGWVSFDTFFGMIADQWLARTSPEKVARVWLNEAQPARQEVEVHASKEHLIGELKQAALDGKRVFVTANSRTLIEKLEAGLREIAPDKRIIAITSETIPNEDVQKFLMHPKVHALEFDAIMTSPAVGTGVDFTFPDNAKLIDVVFGFCEPLVITHTQFDQQLGRVRHPGAVKVWVSPQTFNFETNLDVVRADLRRLGRHHDQLVGFDDDGQEIYREDIPLIRMAALITAEERASENALKANFIRHKEAQGCTIVHVNKDLGAAACGYGLMQVGAQIRDEAYAERIMSADVLPRPAFETVKRRLENGDTVPDDELWAFQRTGIELSYRQPASMELIRLDQRGRHRGQVRLLTMVTRGLINLDRFGQDPAEPLAEQLRFMRNAGGGAYAIARLLRLTPLCPPSASARIAQADGGASALSGLVIDAVIDARDLQDFAKFVQTNKAALETQLGIPIQADVVKKPMQQLGRILGMVGLPLAKPKSVTLSGQKIRRYGIDADACGEMERVIETRGAIKAWQFMTGHYGPRMNPFADDGEDEFDA